jgi:hypothetical protein
MAKSGNRSGGNRNSWGVMDMARERPMAAAATAVGAAAAGLFMWSRRSQISNQLSNLSDQIGEWTDGMNWSGGSGQSGSGDDTAGLTTGGSSGSGSGSGRGRSGSRGMSETGGGNASLGARSGGGGRTSSASGRGRAQQSPTS